MRERAKEWECLDRRTEVQTARGGSRSLSARWHLLAVDRVFLIAPIVPGLNLTPAKENQLMATLNTCVLQPWGWK